MSILWKLIFLNRASSTHHKLALDALRFLRGPHADQWANLFLAEHEQYLTGSKAPDNDFKDFKNHVLHVADGYWGGATSAARQWYQKTVVALSQGDWPEAIYSAGVLSHYFTDPFQPFHTGQTETEGKVHRAAEWSICQSYDELQAILEQDLNGFPAYELPTQTDWLEEAIRQGARTAHESYEVSIEHYDLNRGIKDPSSGLDQELKDRLAQLIGLAVIGFARVLDRAFEESAAAPPDVAVSVHTLLAAMKMPLNWIRKKFADIHERAVIEAIYLEIQDKGKVIEALPEDERIVRKLYAQEVLKVPVRQLDAEPAKATGKQYGSGTPSRNQPFKPVSSPGFQRTVVSHTRTFDVPRGPTAPLETCLMVPLAKEPPKDYVADAVVRAYLQQSELPDTSRQPVSEVVPPRTRTTPTSVPGNAPPITQSVLTIAAHPLVLPEKPASKKDLEKEARRLQRRSTPSLDPEPVLTSPSMPVTSTITAAPSLDLDLPADMFAPLPPAPKVAPQREAPSTIEPIRVAAQPSKATVPPPQSKTRPAQVTPSSVIPAPHIKLPEVVADEPTERNVNRIPVQAPTSTPVHSTQSLRKAVAPQAPVTAALQQPVEQTAAVARRFYLELNSPVVDAPSIGPKTAERLQTIGIQTVGQLLSANPAQAAVELGNPAAAAIIRDWQDQARLVCSVPNLRGHDAQFLVACQVRSASQLRTCEARQLQSQVSTFLATGAGQRLLRGSKVPDLAEVSEWIVAGRDARSV